MARLFNDASSEYAKTSNAIVSGFPFTIAAIVRPDVVNIGQCILSISDDTTPGTQGQHALIMSNNGGGSGGNDLSAMSRKGGGASSFASAVATTGMVADVWYRVMGVFTSTTSRAAYLNGGSKGTNTTSITSSGLNAVDIGRLGDSTPNWHFSGDIAELAIWDAALSDADAAAWGHGVSAKLIRPDKLLCCTPLYGNDSPEISPVGGFDFTLFNTPVKSSHPRIHNFHIPTFNMPITPPPAGGGYPSAYYDAVHVQSNPGMM